MLKKLYPLIWLCLLLPFCKVFGQQNLTGTISGTVKDNTGQTVPGISVAVSGGNNSRQSASDAQGNFRFVGLPFGKYVLAVSGIGYQRFVTDTVVITKSQTMVTLPTIVLATANKKQLKEVSITAQKDFIEHKTDHTVVNVGALISNAGASAADALNQSPGVEVSDEGISLHGREGVVIFIDDKPTHLAGKDLMDYLKSLPAGTLDKIEIMPIPPARYNAAGSAGVINIKTKKTTSDGLNGSFTLGYSQGKRSKSTNSFSFNYKTGKLNVFGNAGYSLNNNLYQVKWDRLYTAANPGLSPMLHQDNMETSTTNGISYRAGFDYEAGKHTTIGIVYSGATTPYTEHGNYQLHFSQLSGVPDSAVSVSSELRQRTGYNSVNFNLVHSFAHPGRDITINLDYFAHSTQSSQTSISDTYLANGSFKSNYTLLSNNTFPAQVYGAKADYNDVLIGDVKLGAGLQTTLSVRNSTGNYSNPAGNAIVANDSLSNRFSDKENINSAYVSLQKSFKRLELQAGLRAENTNATATQYSFTSPQGKGLQFNYTDVFPTVYLAYKLDSAAVDMLNLSAGRRIDRPNYADLNPSVFFFDKYTSYTGNPLLQPAYATTAELSYSHGSMLTVGILLSSANNQMVPIYSLVNQSIIQNTYNIDRVNSYGAYINPSVYPAKWLTLNLYAEVTRSHYLGTVANGIVLDNSLTYFRTNDNAQFKLPNGWNAELSALYRGKRTFGQGYYKPLSQVNASIQKKLLKDKASLTLTARDIFHSNIINRSVTLQQVQLSRIITNDTQQIGIAFSYKFGRNGKTKVHKTGLDGEASRAG